jgi:hypothetical protein
LDNTKRERKIYNTFFLNKFMETIDRNLRWYMVVFVVYELLAFIAGVAAVPFQFQQFAKSMLVGDYLVIVTLLLTIVLGFEASKEAKERLTAFLESLKFGMFAGLTNALTIVVTNLISPMALPIDSLIVQELIALITFSLIGSLIGSFLALALTSKEEARARKR